MYFDIPMCEKKERMNIFKSMPGLTLGVIIAMTSSSAISGVTDSAETGAGASGVRPVITKLDIKMLGAPVLAISNEAVDRSAVATTKEGNPMRKELSEVLALLKELTVDLKIEEEDKSTSYQNAEKRINEQSTKISAQLGGDIGSPSKLDSKVEELQKRLANAKTDDELKEIAAAILSLQAQTAIWVSNTGIMVTPQSGGAEYSVQMNDAIKAINDRVIAGVQNTIRSKPVTCITAYNPSTHMVETRCN